MSSSLYSPTPTKFKAYLLHAVPLDIEVPNYIMPLSFINYMSIPLLISEALVLKHTPPDYTLAFFKGLYQCVQGTINRGY